jgi:integrase
MPKTSVLTAIAVAKIKPASDAPKEVSDGGARGLRLIVYPSGERSWIMRFRRPGGKLAKLTLGPVDLSKAEFDGEPEIGTPLTLAAARVLAAKVKQQIARGVDVVANWDAEKRRKAEGRQAHSASTFPQAAMDFINEHKVARSGHKPRRWRETAKLLGLTFPEEGGEGVVVKKSLCDRWAERAVRDITPDDIYDVIDESRRHGVPGMGRTNKGLSDSRGRRMADALSTMFGWLQKHRRVSTDPTLGAHRPPPPPARDRVLNVKTDVENANELRWFWAAAGQLGVPYGVMCKLLLVSGCRLEEIAHMQWRELSDDRATLRLPGSRTKNGRPYNVPLPQIARDLISSVSPVKGCSYVFTTNGKTPISGFSKYKARLDTVMLSIARADRDDDEVTIEPWRVHDLRRTAATGMAGIGIQPHIIESVLNHVSGAKAGVAGTYNREAYEPEKRVALERWAEYVTGVIGGRPSNVVPMTGRSA